jgi:EAL domain-containing protein (putative c-di-GMP-specific phosphodiesterase class I)
VDVNAAVLVPAADRLPPFLREISEAEQAWQELCEAARSEIPIARVGGYEHEVDRGTVEDELRRTGVDPRALVFEVTETVAIGNTAEACRFAQRLSSLGCAFALDDFGAGFSSFYSLKHLPFDYLKIDGEFIRNLTANADDQHIVKAIVQIAVGLGKQTIAEFVGDAATVGLLRQYGVDFAQGYHVGKPRPLAEVHLPPRDLT